MLGFIISYFKWQAIVSEVPVYLYGDYSFDYHYFMYILCVYEDGIPYLYLIDHVVTICQLPIVK